jgi:type I restriction enzyme S subunit
MTQETFFEKFDQLADTPNAVAKMRELLIHFGVIGKLVPNDSDEKPVGLKLSGTSDDDSSSSSNWRSGLLGDAFTFEYGDNLPAPKRSQTGEYPVYGSNGIVGTHDAYLTKEPAIIVGRKGSAGALNITTGPSWTTDVAYFVRPPRDLDLRFTYYLFSTLRLDELGKGIKPGLSRKEAYALPIALPPLAEQKRIVAKVDELMALCDRLEAQQQERETRHAALAHASLARFADAPIPANLDFLFHDSYTIEPADLRKSIHTLAVQGKLVGQDPNDESAKQLLERIVEHKSELAKAGKLRAGTTIATITTEDGDYELPPNWVWARFGEIMINRDGERIPVSREERSTKAKVYDYYGASGVIDKIDGYLFEKPLLLIGEDGANLINRATPIAFIARGKYWVNNHAHVLDGISEDSLRYIELHINAINLELYVTGSAQPKMNQAKMNSIPIALPPLAEQRRIVAKVDQLMALVDQLETQRTTSRAIAGKLMEAVVVKLTAQD